MPEFPKFNNMIGPANLLSLVRNTAPFLFQTPFTNYAEQSRGKPLTNKRLIELGGHAYGFLDVLYQAQYLEGVDNPNVEQREDYFALCIACHHATVATFIPTDVDSKIRGVLWGQREDPAALRRMLDFSLQAMKWDISRISTRATELSGVGPVSGHNGEMLGVLAGGLGAFLRTGDKEYAEKAADAIDAEMKREAHEFRFVLGMPGRELDLLRLSSSLTHNCGDLDQGISFWTNRDIYEPYRARFARIAHENTQVYDGTFQIAAKLYKRIMSSEGHRHYPLRDIRAIRQTPHFLLPLGPFLDDWGDNIGRHPLLKKEERAEVLAALLIGCKKIAGQQGYFRAISGMARGLNGHIDDLAKYLPSAARHELKEPQIRQCIALKQVSFESGMRKKAQAVLSEK